jgi:ribonuclease J
MKKYVSIAAELGYIDIPSDLVQSVEHVARLPRARQLFLSTGSQGEMHAGLSLLAAGQHKSLQVDQDDLVIVSARVIPGNQREVARLINNLYRTGAEVMHEGNSVVHASGHASQADLQLMLNLTQPRYFVPVHGEYHHLLRHAQLAGEAGIEPEGIFVIEDGVGLEATPVSARLVSGYPVGRVLVEGARVGGQDAAVVRERNYLRREGALAVSVALDSAGRIVAGPEITTRGVVYVKESAQFFDDLREVIVTELTPLAGRSPGVTSDEATAHLRRTVRRFTRQRLGRSPLLLMVVLRP